MRVAVRETGFALLEIFLSLSIGLVVVAGMVHLYSANKASYQSAEALARIQENQRFVLYYMRHHLELAGLPKYLDLQPVWADSDMTSDGNGGGSDSLAIQFRGISDCLGNRSESDALIRNHYFVREGQLMCQSNINGEASPEAIVEGVDHLQFRYGLDTDEDGIANQYVDASRLYDDADPAVWERLVGVRLHLLMNSVVPAHTLEVSRVYRVPDGSSLQFNDRLHRQWVSATMLFRNRIN